MASPAVQILDWDRIGNGGGPALATEQELHLSLVEHWRWRAARGAFGWHCANGGARRRVEASILKGMGVTPGVPDWLALHQGHLFGLELKTETGKLTEAQRVTHEHMRRAGATVASARGIDEALAQLDAWGLLR
jgi:hypothetical protein